jgi:hypothetical protein
MKPARTSHFSFLPSACMHASRSSQEEQTRSSSAVKSKDRQVSDPPHRGLGYRRRPTAQPPHRGAWSEPENHLSRSRVTKPNNGPPDLTCLEARPRPLSLGHRTAAAVDRQGMMTKDPRLPKPQRAPSRDSRVESKSRRNRTQITKRTRKGTCEDAKGSEPKRKTKRGREIIMKGGETQTRRGGGARLAARGQRGQRRPTRDTEGEKERRKEASLASPLAGGAIYGPPWRGGRVGDGSASAAPALGGGRFGVGFECTDDRIGRVVSGLVLISELTRSAGRLVMGRQRAFHVVDCWCRGGHWGREERAVPTAKPTGRRREVRGPRLRPAAECRPLALSSPACLPDLFLFCRLLPLCHDQNSPPFVPY